MTPRDSGAAACCSAESRAAGEALTGSAPSASAWLFVHYADAWSRDPVADSSLSVDAKVALLGADGVRVQLMRRHGRQQPDGVPVFAAYTSDSGSWVEATVLRTHDDLVHVDLAALARGESLGWTPHHEPLFFVCTNGRRDVCCAELGRPVAKTLKAYWPEATWETTHLGGHRFAGTLVAFPWAVALGRLDAMSAYTACQALIDGHLPQDHLRGSLG